MTLLALISCNTQAPQQAVCVARLGGQVTDVEGIGLNDVEVTLQSNGQTVRTDADGNYLFEGLDEDADLRISYRADGYAPGWGRASVACWETGVAGQQLLGLDGEGTLSSSEGGTVEVGEVTVTLGEDAVVDAEGNPFSGDVLVTIAHLDPTTELYAGPGDLTGLARTEDGGEEEQLLITYGMVEISLYDEDGNPLQLDEGRTAAVSVPLVQSHLIEEGQLEAGDSQRMWAYDEDRGLWIEETVGTVYERDDGSLGVNFDAAHFTWWNVDDGAVAYCATGRVVDVLGFPIRGAKVTCLSEAPPEPFPDSSGGGGDRDLNLFADSLNYATTNADGVYECEVWAGSVAHFGADTIVAAQTWTSPVTTVDVRGSTESVNVCEPIPDLQIDVCRESGIVMADDLRIHLSGLEDDDADRLRAWFWEPPGEPWRCDDPWESVPMDSCVVATPEDFPDAFRPRSVGIAHETREAGSSITMSVGGSDYVMDKSAINGEAVYMWESVTLEDGEVNRNKVQLAGGDQVVGSAPGSSDHYFGPIVNENWMTIPAALELEGVSGPLGAHPRSTDLKLSFDGQGNSDHLFVFVVTAGDTDGLMCRYADDGELVIASEDLSTLSADYASVSVYRPNIDWTTGADGLPIRVQGLSGQVVEVELR
jgi:hypothetical protein